MDKISDLARRLSEFRDARNWKQFHTPKELALSLQLEAAELLELFQWRNGEQLTAHLNANRKQLEDECADILNCLIMLTDNLNIDLYQAALNKIEKNARKYPVELVHGSCSKYTEYHTQTDEK